jgi:hypothetical protein
MFLSLFAILLKGWTHGTHFGMKWERLIGYVLQTKSYKKCRLNIFQTA